VFLAREFCPVIMPGALRGFTSEKPHPAMIRPDRLIFSGQDIAAPHQQPRYRLPYGKPKTPHEAKRRA
jgi:hypothetical protein